MIRYFCDLCGKEQNWLYEFIFYQGYSNLERNLNICEECAHKIDKYTDRIVKHEDK